MFIGVDGTQSPFTPLVNFKDAGVGAYMSRFEKGFVYKIFSETKEKNSEYFMGPTTPGLEVQDIAQAIADLAYKWFREDGDGKVFLAGFSRGGGICVLAAQLLLKNKNFHGNIDCLALFDAVDRAPGDPSVIPRNVSRAYHVFRDPLVASQPLFGNTAMRSELPNVLETQKFFATHAGLGGVPWTGDTPSDAFMETRKVFGRNVSVPVWKPTITKGQDIANSAAAGQWMWTRIRRHGMVP